MGSVTSQLPGPICGDGGTREGSVGSVRICGGVVYVVVRYICGGMVYVVVWYMWWCGIKYVVLW